ncbi:conjugal transfer protein [Streptococcus parauberis]|nr:conjugal transfer protein [Streptococcus parauberis]MDT2748982.1 conjugal transfer protein [Streptococcus parauberis]
MLAGVATATPALNPPYLTGGYKSTENSRKGYRKPFGYKEYRII